MKFGTRLKIEEDVSSSSTADIAFLLIIFFMVTTAFGTTRGLEMTLPKKQKVTQEVSTTEAVLVEIDDYGNIFIDGGGVLLEHIEPYIRPKLARNPNKYVLIKSSLAAKYEYAVSVVDELRLSGVKNISIPTQKEIASWGQY
ncbi:biopolymer transporter ExbD [bacterium]|nr:biopolymer transporter ExbD [bacterium]